MSKRNIDLYEERKSVLEKIQLAEFQDYHIGKLLYAELWNMGQLSILQKVIRIIAYVIFNCLHISESDDLHKNNKLTVEIKGFNDAKRADNELIYANVSNYFKPCGHMLVYKKLKLEIKGLLNRLVSFGRYIGQIDELGFCNRAFLAAQLVMCRNFIILLETKNIFADCKYFLVFQESELIENTLVQTAKLHDVTVVSLQHGMPMNRHEDKDQLHFDCFSVDYKLCWNEATKKQFLSAGIDEEKLVVVGNTKKMHMPLTVKREKNLSDIFGVVLDAPIIDQGIDNNKTLIMMAVKLTTEFGLDCVVKLHPFDKKENYLSETRSSFAKVSILDVSTTMEEYERLVDFSLGHTTGAMLDLIYDGCFVFQYKTEVEYPIETDDIYIFHDYEELKRNYLQWKENYEFYKNQYKDITKKYRVDNPIELHDRFFKTLFQS